MIGRKRIKTIWVGSLVTFLIFSIAFTSHTGLLLSPGPSTQDLGKLLFAGLVVMLLIILIWSIVISYFMHELEE